MEDFMSIENDNEERKLTELFRQLSNMGRLDALSYVNTLRKAEMNVKRQYGLEAEAPRGKGAT
jgi:hypothetical protein